MELSRREKPEDYSHVCILYGHKEPDLEEFTVREDGLQDGGELYRHLVRRCTTRSRRTTRETSPSRELWSTSGPWRLVVGIMTG